MNKEKISSQEIIDLVALKASVSKRAAEEFLKVMIASIEESLLAKETVKIKNFGTFKLQWNESRKSVNIQTGEEIILDGYYKVVFTPDALLREQINEPFAHLEPVELDVDYKKSKSIKDNEVILDPIRIFSEQATEIKNLINEIQTLSSIINPEYNQAFEIITEEKKIEIKVHDNKEDDLKSIKEKPIQNENIQSFSIQAIENEETKPFPDNSVETHLFSEHSASSYLDNIKPKKKKKLWLLISLFLIIGLGAGVGTAYYFFYNPETKFQHKYSVNYFSEDISISQIVNSISKWFEPSDKPISTTVKVVKLKEKKIIDSISKNQRIDSLQILFDNPRTYNSFISSERIKAGNRLTNISKLYFGNKVFWVYIYEANKERISNPDNIPIGTLIRIPKLDQRLVDTTNQRCLEKAKELHDIYIK